MAKASLRLSNGTVVTLEGTPEEVKELLGLYGGERQRAPKLALQGPPSRKPQRRAPAVNPNQTASADKIDLNAIVTLIKDCDEAEMIEAQILNRPAQVNRTLLPLYIVHEHLDNAVGLTSGEVTKITTDLGIPISQPNASRTLSGTAAKYVIGDKVKTKGQAVRYKLSRRGRQYIKQVIAGNANG